MNFRKLQMGFLRGPEGDAGGSGGSNVSAIAAQLFNDNNTANNDKGGGSAGNSESGDSGDAGADHGADRSGGKGAGNAGDPDAGHDRKKRKGGSILADSLKEIEEAEEASRAGRGKEDTAGDDSGSGASGDLIDKDKDKDKDKKPGDKKVWDGKTPLTDDELMKLEAPISAQPAAAFNALKARIKTLNEEKRQLQESQSSDGLTEQLTALQTQLAEREGKLKELQEQIDTEYFESSPGFQETFKKPVQEAIATLKPYFEEYSYKENPEECKTITSKFELATKHASEGNRSQFLKVMDELSEEFLEGGTALKTAFIGDAKDFYKAHNALALALKEKGGDRGKLVEAKVAEMRSKSKVGIERDIDNHVKRFEVEHQSFLDSIPPEVSVKFKALYQESDKETKQLLTEFATTGKVPEKLNQIIAQGVTYKAAVANGQVAWAALKDAGNKNTILQNKVKELEKKLERYTGEPEQRRGMSSPNSVNREQGERKHKSAIMSELAGIIGD